MTWIERILNPKGDQSATRLAFLWLIANATFMGWFVLIFGTEHAAEAGSVMGVVSGIASGFKLYQNKQEKDAK